MKRYHHHYHLSFSHQNLGREEAQGSMKDLIILSSSIPSKAFSHQNQGQVQSTKPHEIFDNFMVSCQRDINVVPDPRPRKLEP